MMPKTAYGLFFLLFTLTGLHLHGQGDFSTHDRLFNYYLNNDVDRANEELEQQEKTCTNETEQLTYQSNRISFLIKKNLLDSAENQLENLPLLNDPSTCNARGKYLILKSSILSKRTRFRESIATLQNGFPLYACLEKQERSTIFQKLAAAYFRLGMIDSAQWFSDRSMDEAYGLPGPEAMQLYAANYTLRGEIYLFKGEYDSSYTFHLKALNLYTLSNNVFGKASALSSIAGIMLFQDEFRKALDYYNQALPNYQAVKSKPYDIFNNMGIAYEKLHVVDSSVYYYKLAYNGALASGRMDIQANAAGGLGNIYVQLGLWDSSIFFYQKAQVLFENFHSDYGVALCKMGLGHSYLMLNDFQKAEIFSAEALELAKKIGSKELLKQCYEVTYEVKLHREDYKGAFEDHKAYTDIKDSLSGESMKHKISALEVQYETNLKSIENEKLKSELAAKDQIRKLDRTFYILSVILLVLLVLVLLFYYRSQKQKLKLKQVEVANMQIQNELLTANIEASKKAILAKNAIIDNLEKTAAENPVDYTAVSQKLLDKINSTDEWAEFMIEFNQLYKKFYDKLNAMASESLTKNDLRLAALIKLNLSNKEISDLLNISVDAVKKAKNRFSKKFNLPENESVTALITTI